MLNLAGSCLEPQQQSDLSIFHLKVKEICTKLMLARRIISITYFARMRCRQFHFGGTKGSDINNLYQVQIGDGEMLFLCLLELRHDLDLCQGRSVLQTSSPLNIFKFILCVILRDMFACIRALVTVVSHITFVSLFWKVESCMNFNKMR